jgi:hypothetical protein
LSEVDRFFNSPPFVTRNHRQPAGRPAMHAAMQISGSRIL